MNTCGTCKYRGAPIMRNDESTNWEDVPSDWFQCDLIKHAWAESDLLGDGAKAGAAVIDGSGYYAALCVASDFGCNKWERAVPSIKEKP